MKVLILKSTAFFYLLLVASKVLAQEVKIGVVLPLTGGAASNGESIKNSILLADAKYDRDDRVRFLFEDDRLQPRLTVTAVKKMIRLMDSSYSVRQHHLL